MGAEVVPLLWDKNIKRRATDWKIGGSRPGRGWEFSRSHHHVQTGSAAHPASYTMGTRGSYPWGKAAGAW